MYCFAIPSFAVHSLAMEATIAHCNVNSKKRKEITTEVGKNNNNNNKDVLLLYQMRTFIIKI